MQCLTINIPHLSTPHLSLAEFAGLWLLTRKDSASHDIIALRLTEPKVGSYFYDPLICQPATLQSPSPPASMAKLSVGREVKSKAAQAKTASEPSWRSGSVAYLLGPGDKLKHQPLYECFPGDRPYESIVKRPCAVLGIDKKDRAIIAIVNSSENCQLP